MLTNIVQRVKVADGEKADHEKNKVHSEEDEAGKGGDVAINTEVEKYDPVAVKIDETEGADVKVEEEKIEPEGAAAEAAPADTEETVDGPDPLPEGSSFFIFSNTNK